MKEQKNIIYESNGAKAGLRIDEDNGYLQMIMSHPNLLEQLAEEIKAFRKYFWANEHEDWMGVDQEYLHFFTPDMMLKPIDEEGNILFYDDIETGLWQKESKEESKEKYIFNYILKCNLGIGDIKQILNYDCEVEER